jgi:hypothetical protein
VEQQAQADQMVVVTATNTMAQPIQVLVVLVVPTQVVAVVVDLVIILVMVERVVQEL